MHIYIYIYIYVKVDIGGKHIYIYKRSNKLGGFSATFATEMLKSTISLAECFLGQQLNEGLIKMVQGPRTLFARNPANNIRSDNHETSESEEGLSKSLTSSKN